jgi:hypothetical protein
LFVDRLLSLDAYWIRELIFIETILPFEKWLRSNVIECETIEDYARESVRAPIDNTNDIDDQIIVQHPYAIELRQLVDILEMLCIQVQQVQQCEIQLEHLLRQLLDERTRTERKQST